MGFDEKKPLRTHRNALLEVAHVIVAQALQVHRDLIDDAQQAQRVGDPYALSADIDFQAQGALTRLLEAIRLARRQESMLRNRDSK